MHTLPPPPGQDVTTQWVLWIVGVAWLAYTTWKAKAASHTANAASTKADTNEVRLNGHADMIQTAQATAAEAKTVASVADTKASLAVGTQSNFPAPIAPPLDPNATQLMQTGSLPTAPAADSPEGSEGD